MKLTEKELKEAKLASLKDRRLSELQNIWNREVEIRDLRKYEFQGNKTVSLIIREKEKDIEQRKHFLEVLEEKINELEK